MGKGEISLLLLVRHSDYFEMAYFRIELSW